MRNFLSFSTPFLSDTESSMLLLSLSYDNKIMSHIHSASCPHTSVSQGQTLSSLPVQASESDIALPFCLSSPVNFNIRNICTLSSRCANMLKALLKMT